MELLRFVSSRPPPLLPPAKPRLSLRLLSTPRLLPPPPPPPSSLACGGPRGRGLALRPARSTAAHGAAEKGGLSPASGDGAEPPSSIWKQMRDIALFAGPATGLWICGPLMSLIDTMVIGQSSTLELAALGPGTVFCDNLSYIFMFLSIATSNMVATSLAKEDQSLAQHQISMLLFVAFASGLVMFLFTKFLGIHIITAFAGSENIHIISSANIYVQIRAFAWPAVLVGMVAQSAS